MCPLSVTDTHYFQHCTRGLMLLYSCSSSFFLSFYSWQPAVHGKQHTDVDLPTHTLRKQLRTMKTKMEGRLSRTFWLFLQTTSPTGSTLVMTERPSAYRKQPQLQLRFYKMFYLQDADWEILGFKAATLHLHEDSHTQKVPGVSSWEAGGRPKAASTVGPATEAPHSPGVLRQRSLANAKVPVVSLKAHVTSSFGKDKVQMQIFEAKREVRELFPSKEAHPVREKFSGAANFFFTTPMMSPLGVAEKYVS